MDVAGMPIETVSALGAGWALVAVFVGLIFKGKIVPRQSLDDVIHDRNEWRAESRIKDAQIAEKDTQLRILAEIGETEKHVLGALAEVTGRGHES